MSPRARAAGLLLGALLQAPGCRAPVAAPETAEARAAYQRIADALPRASFGWGTPPAIASLSASARAEGPAPAPEPLLATERGFRVVCAVQREESVWIPYSALVEASWEWRPIPNALLAPLLVVPIQVVRTTVVFDAEKVPGLLARIDREAARLEAISREIGLGGPWSFAQGVRAKVQEDAAAWGSGRLSLSFDYLVPCPPWIPQGGPALETAQAFAWARAHPEEPELPREPAPGAGD